MKRLVILAAMLASTPAAYANTHCDAVGGYTIGASPIGLVPGTYIPYIDATGVERINVPTVTGGIVPLRTSQLTTLGIPFSFANSTPLQLSCGSPDSANFRAVADALDMDFDFDLDGDSDTIGGAATAWSVANEDGQRFDLKYAKGIRLSERNRTRLLITVPARYLNVNSTAGGLASAHGGLKAFSIGLGVGVQIPVSTNWWLTPRVSYTATDASKGLGGDGELASATLSSNYRFAGIGRGELTMGNLVGYTQTVRTGITSQDSADYFKQRNWWFRNGLAYQLPLGGRMFGRQTSLRTSYVFTLGAKDTMAFEQVHEAAINFGFRMRETEQRAGSDLLRVGLLYTHAKNEYFKNADYDSLTLTVGYRF
ncbi:hypothetical protein [Sphingobium cupriresistens]|uniref:DUF2219 family protein n=1 Tax=Sphingobium cupriresistens TaxID=1132417 RepID=A0A8G1ZJ35_9SPHN|nr:hypothetical protein [Sphingobium cupriresistens]RYM14516.1 hypothetical protein EWH12_01820 [Sphingobium cupriresistens]